MQWFGGTDTAPSSPTPPSSSSLPRYLDTVFPELFVPGDAVGSGELRNCRGGARCPD